LRKASMPEKAPKKQKNTNYCRLERERTVK